MNVRDLRVGNIISYNPRHETLNAKDFQDSLVVVMSIRKVEHTGDIKDIVTVGRPLDDQVLVADLDKFEGVMLSSKGLSALGFKKISESRYAYNDFWVEFLTWEIDGVMFEKVALVGFKYQSFATFETLNDLQNTYYAVKRQELPVEEIIWSEL